MNCPVSLPSRYSIIGQTEGGQGVIFICNDSELERQVIVKCLKDSTQQHRIIDEIKALQQIRSKHVVEIYDLISDDNNIALLLEYINGSELAQYGLKDRNVPTQLKILYQIACGIADIHSFNHIHRDIKPYNMKVDGEGIVKILDFGLSRQENVDDRTVGFNGTPGFAAPELYSAGTVNFTSAIDVYAFSCSVWLLCTGVLPAELRSRPPVTMTQRLRDSSRLPPEVADLIDTGLAVNPKARPQMREIKDLLGRYLVHGQHQGIAYLGSQTYKISSSNKLISIRFGVNEIKIGYDDLDFLVKEVSGEVKINNQIVSVGMKLPTSCIMAMGIHPRVSFVPFDISNPEVVL
ncbi:MAG TPA: serine/threonine-protein kinase [Alphaproteobacteria bacterium]|nr:serine/threonine-protein kinase [Alphaproteobacteria bacterium]